MADKKPKGAPGAKPASTTLRVTDPNDSRLKMYEDSVTATGRAIESNKFVDRLDKMPMDKRRIEVLKGYKPAAGSGAAIGRLEKANKKPYKEGDSSVGTSITAPDGFGYNQNKSGKRIVEEKPGVTVKTLEIYNKNVLTPKREVVLVKPPRPKPKPAPERKVSEPIEPIQPRAASTKLAKEEPEMVAPVVRPVKKEFKETRAGMGAMLRYPSQDLMSKVKRKLTGESNMPYWEDKEGVKRYPSKGENNPKDVQEKEMIKKD